MSEADAAIKNALDPENFPRWAQAAPKSFEAFTKSIARAAVALNAMPLSPQAKVHLTAVLGDVAATCWTAGAASVRESNGATLPPLKQ